jgi:SRSO17 transposase
MQFSKACERALLVDGIPIRHNAPGAPCAYHEYMMATLFSSDNLSPETTLDRMIDSSPLRSTVQALPPVTVQVASETDQESLWDHLVRLHHYLGYQKLLGHRIKYLAYIQERPVAALSFSAPALKLRVRDKFIGWSVLQRQQHLDRIANNSRFLILPWIEVKNLASHVLAKTMSRLTRDWEERFGQRLWLAETFVDPSRYKGTCYKAANWRFIGQTAGSGKQGKGYFHHGVVKEVYLYALEPRFRKMIGCEQQPYSLFHRPSPNQKKVEDLEMLLRHADWNPNIMPRMDLTESDVHALANELTAFHAEFHDCFGRKEHRRLGLAYLSGLLSNNEAKSVEPIALAFLDKNSVRPLQRFMKSYGWGDAGMEARHQTMLAREIADPNGMITTDSSEFLKKGKESVGVARQYCGRYGKTDNCQSGVFIGYTSLKGYGLLTSKLYMPKSWFTEEYRDRREYNLVPDALVFRTKPEIAAELIRKIDETNLFPAKWIGADATFGSDWAFLDALPQDKYYFAAIKSNARVVVAQPQVGLPSYSGHGRRPTKPRLMRGKIYTVAKMSHSKRLNWKKMLLAEGAKGPIFASVARIRVYPIQDDLPREAANWLFLRKMEDGQIKYAFSNAPEAMPMPELCEAATMRWPIEQCFQDGKSEVGMDKYEHRSWPAWHRHMLYVFLALQFLLRLRLRLKKSSGADVTAGSDADAGGAALRRDDAGSCIESRAVS